MEIFIDVRDSPASFSVRDFTFRILESQKGALESWQKNKMRTACSMFPELDRVVDRHIIMTFFDRFVSA